MPSLKDLYMSKNLDELNTWVDVKQKIGSSRMLVRSAEKVFKGAEDALKMCDEEKAYVLFMRYFNLRKAVKSCADYKKNEDFITAMLSRKDAMKAIEEAERLQQSLKNRYELVDAERIKAKMDLIEENSKKAALEKKEEEEKKKQEEMENNNKKAEETEPASPGSISVEQLYMLFQDGSNLIVMDIRPSAQYEASRINHRSVINIPSEIIPPGCTVKDIEKGLTENSTGLWSQRGTVDQIVMLDWQCSASEIPLGSPIRSLKDAIFKWDQRTIIRSEPLVLEGGYDNWLLYYPTMTTNATVPRPPSYTQLSKQDNSLNFEYPDFDEMFGLKPEPPLAETAVNGTNGLTENNAQNNLPRPESMPRFDRASKPSVRNVKNDLGNETSQASDKTTKGSSSGGIFENLRQQLEDVSNKSNVTNYKPTNIELEKSRQVNQQPSPVAKPSVPGLPSRSLKPKQEMSSSRETTPEPTVKTVQENAADSLSIQKAKELERMIAEHKARVAQLKTDEDKLEKLHQLKHKEERDVAGLMRLKRKINDELKTLEDEKQNLATMKGDGEEKRQLQIDVEKLRLERKLREEKEERMRLQRELDERDAKESAARTDREQVEKDRMVALEKEQRLKDDAKKKLEEENERERLRREEEEEEQWRKRKESEEKARVESAAKEKLRNEAEILEQQKIKHEAEVKARLEREAAEKREKQEVERARILAEEKLRIEAEVREKVQLETEAKERARLAEEAKERAQLVKQAEEKARLEADAEAKERLRIAAETKARLEAEAKEKARQEEEAQQARVSIEQLPSGWQKKYDEKSKRYFYVDHNSGSTQWTAPSNSSVAPAPSVPTKKPQWKPPVPRQVAPSGPSSREPAVYKTKLKDESDAPRSSSLKRSNSSPNIAKMVDAEKENRIPSVNRLAKPSDREIEPEPRSKPVFSEISAARLRSFSPIYGGRGRGLTGLRNMGNTCYLNSVVQCLSNTAPLAVYFMSGTYQQDINRENFLGHKGEIADEFGILVAVLWNGQYSSVTPWNLKHIVAKHADRFATSEQQDSQEFLVFLLDGLHEDLNKVKVRPRLGEIDADKMGMEEAANLSWKQHKLLNQSLMVELFQGQLRSVVRCLHCDKKSIKFDTFMYLSLPLPAGRSRCSLQDALELFMKGEKMTGSSKWHCPKCKVPRDAEKFLDIWKLPHVLLIHFKRFYFRGMWRDKLTTSVEFPLSDLDMKSYVVGPKKPKSNYNLYALSLHKGQSMEHGHYTAICKSPMNQRWYNFDDSDVYNASTSDIRNSQSQAYLLFYSATPNAVTL